MDKQYKNEDLLRQAVASPNPTALLQMQNYLNANTLAILEKKRRLEQVDQKCENLTDGCNLATSKIEPLEKDHAELQRRFQTNQIEAKKREAANDLLKAENKRIAEQINQVKQEEQDNAKKQESLLQNRQLWFNDLPKEEQVNADLHKKVDAMDQKNEKLIGKLAEMQRENNDWRGKSKILRGFLGDIKSHLESEKQGMTLYYQMKGLNAAEAVKRLNRVVQGINQDYGTWLEEPLCKRTKVNDNSADESSSNAKNGGSSTSSSSTTSSQNGNNFPQLE